VAARSASVGPRSKREWTNVVVARTLGKLQFTCGPHQDVLLCCEVKTANLVRQRKEEESLVVAQVVASMAVN
jgi:hypothetical protein